MNTVLCVGVFDLLHIAHKRHLEEARGMADLLVVGVTIDACVNKEGRPIISQDERLEMIRSLHCVSMAILCQDSIEALDRVRPQIFCKGHDYKKKGLLPEEIKFCSEHGIEIRFTHHNPQTTSQIIERIRND